MPKGTYLRVVVFPFHKHLMSFLDKRSLSLGLLCGGLAVHALCHVLCLELGYLLAVVLVEGHVVVAYQVVALLA